LELLEEAAELGIIAAVAAGVDCYTFSHPLLRETLYAEASPAQRECWQAQVEPVREQVSVACTRHQPDACEQARPQPDMTWHTVQNLAMPDLTEPGLAGPNLFRQEGDYWTLAYQGTTCRLKDTKGLHYLAALLQAPGKEISAINLVSTWDAGWGLAIDQGARHNRPVRQPLDVGPRLDAPARAAYKRRLRELQNELADAQRLSDAIRITTIQSEMDFLTHELASTLGIGGRNRTTGSIAERARSTVTKSIKATIRKICGVHPTLGQHLTTHIKTGTFCQYLPAPNQPRLTYLR
jgi:hypothetical protein